MGTAIFKQGTHVEIHGKEFSMLRKIESELWQLEETRTKRIQEFSLVQLQTYYVDGILKFPNSRSLPEHQRPKIGGRLEYTPEQWEQAKIRRAYAVATLDVPNTRVRLVPVIQAVSEKLGLTEKSPNAATVIRWKNKYLHAGKDITSLIDQSSRKGNSNSRYPKEVEKIANQAIQDVYLKRERGTIQDALERSLGLVLRENTLLPPSMQLPRPSRRLIKRLIDAIPAFDRYVARHGVDAANKKFRTVMGYRLIKLPLERAEIDHTRLDLMVVDGSTGLPLGRPWITVCLDSFSRCVLGIHISFDPPSYLSVARCLKHAFRPKVKLQEQYPSITNPWLAHGVMQQVVVDNGLEFHSSDLENACYSLGVEIHYAPRKQAWFKGLVERFIGTMNRNVAHGVPGTTFSNIFDKDEYDPVKHAVVSYSVLKEIIFKWVVDVYHQQPHRALGIPPSLMWERSIAPEDILVPEDQERLDAILGSSEVRVLSHKGIELNGMYYNSPDLSNLRRRHGDRFEVDVRVDKSDLGSIIVFSPDKRAFFKVPALRSEYAFGLSDWQHRVCKRYAARVLECANPDGWLEAKMQISELINAEMGNSRRKLKTRTRIARFVGEGDLGAKAGNAPSSVQPPPPSGTMSPAMPQTIYAMPMPETHPKRFTPVFRERAPQFLADEEKIGK